MLYSPLYSWFSQIPLVLSLTIDIVGFTCGFPLLPQRAPIRKECSCTRLNLMDLAIHLISPVACLHLFMTIVAAVECPWIWLKEWHVVTLWEPDIRQFSRNHQPGGCCRHGSYWLFRYVEPRAIILRWRSWKNFSSQVAWAVLRSWSGVWAGWRSHRQLCTHCRKDEEPWHHKVSWYVIC